MKTARALKALLPVPLTLACSLALAQDTSSDDEMDAVLEEVLVTATRRVSDLQTTPVAVTALSGEELDQLFATDIGSIALVTPNFSAASITGFNAAGFALRGASQTDVLVYWEPPVGVIVDDFVIPHVQTQLLDPFDIESVEVLRGPQGTLFGKNTTAGAVVVKTRRPELETLSVDARLRIGNYGRVEPRFALNIPIGDSVAFRLAGMGQESDGYYRNGKVSPSQATEPTNERIGGDDVQTARAKLLWEPTDNLSLLFQYEYLKDRSDTPPAVNTTDPDAPQAWNLIGFPGITGGDPLDQAGVSFRDFIDGPGSETTGLFMSEGHRIDVDGYYLNIDWTFADGRYTLTSVTGQREQKSRLPSTYTGERFGSLFDATRDDDRETFQQEIRLASYFDGPFNFVAGAFYQTDETSFNVLQYLGLLDFFGTGVPGVLDNDNPLIISNNQDAESIAGFIDVTWDFADTWQLAGGIRYTDETKEFFSRPGTPIVLYGRSPGDYPFDPNNEAEFPCTATTPCQTDKQSWNEPTYRLMLSNQFTPDHYGYALFSTGFKSGGYSDQAGSGLQVPLERTAYDPETATSFELGLKSDLMGGRARLNTALFYVKYEDMQRAAIAQQGAFQETVVFNAAEVPAWGVEFEGSFLITENLVARANLGYLDTKYDEFLLDLDLDGTPDQDLSGRTVTRSPEWTAGLDLTWTSELSGGSMLRALGGVYYEDESTFYYAPVGDGEFDTFLESRTLFDANVTWTAPNGMWWVSAYGKNLTDERYKSASQYVGGLWTFSTYAPPRTYGVEVGIFFSN
jgi:iron complex outermembrane receptor protein